MLDIKFIRENPEKVKESLKKRGVDVNIDGLLELDKKRRERLREIEELRSQQNKLGQDNIERAQEVKAQIKNIEPELERTERELNGLMFQLPNMPLDDVPVGKDERDNKVIREEGRKPKFNFEPKDYLEIGEKLDIIDVKRAAKVSGTRFGYLKGAAAQLEFALVQFAFDVLTKESFVPIVPPVLIQEKAMQGMGYVDTKADRGERYFLEKDKLYLVGTSEQAIGPMHQDEVFEEKDLPKRYVAFSTCFREEAGSYGKDTKGILRVHQFDKLEMFSFSHPEKSREEHQFLLKMAEKLLQKLEVPYRVVQMCTGDLARPSAATYDIESWLPGQPSLTGLGQGQYRETHSVSNCTDFQARRLNVRYRAADGKLHFVHTLNGTAFAIGRTLIAIIENYQQKNGRVRVPRALQRYAGMKEIKRPA